MKNLVLAELVANVLTIVVETGAPVEAGDTLVILESMKMEIPVLAEVSGTIAEIAVSVGEVITEGDTIAVIESAR
ncbi:MAG: acetyl-CoA carboxylase [Frankiales bacterium]|nr:acetyl-CoA carboxylase [Frankiales bacterium]